MTTLYTEDQQRLLNQRVILNQDLVCGSVPSLCKGDRATIIDFGRTSGDPIVWCDRTEHEYVVPWLWIELLEEEK